MQREGVFQSDGVRLKCHVEMSMVSQTAVGSNLRMDSFSLAGKMLCEMNERERDNDTKRQRESQCSKLSSKLIVCKPTNQILFLRKSLPFFNLFICIF